MTTIAILQSSRLLTPDWFAIKLMGTEAAAEAVAGILGALDKAEKAVFAARGYGADYRGGSQTLGRSSAKHGAVDQVCCSELMVRLLCSYAVHAGTAARCASRRLKRHAPL